MKSSAAPRPIRWQPFAAGALLAMAAVLVYWPALTGGFVWDDDTMLTRNDMVKAASGLYRMWFTTEPLDYWPLTNSSLWLEWRVWGMHSTGYHVTNLLLHISSGLLVWAILRRLMIPGALLAAFLFVVHPVNVESVAWIAQRKNTLSMVFFLLSILWFLRQEFPPAEPEKPPTRRSAASKPSSTDRSGVGPWYWLSLVTFVLAMLSKGSVAILPGVLLLLIWWRRGAITRTDLLRTVPFFAVAGALTLLNIWFQRHYMTGGIRHVTFVQRALGAGAVIWFYLDKALLPIRLSFVYPQWEIRSDDVRWWLPLSAALATTALLVWQRRRPMVRALLCAWMFFCLALLPVMGFTDVYFMTFSLVADHYQHIALLGVVACVAAGVSLASGHVQGPVGVRLWGGVLVVVLGLATWRQSREYTDPETLYRSTLAINPSSSLMHNNLGAVLVDRSIDEAISQFRESLRLNPDRVAYNNLCHALEQAGRTNEAITACEQALRVDPTLSTAHNDLGAALASLGHADQARAEFEAALKLDGNYADAHNNLANILIATGHQAEAIDHYREALRVTPDFAAAHGNLGLALDRQGKTDEAINQYREALRLEPNLAAARNRLDALLRQSGQTEAIARDKDALRSNPGQPGLHVSLGNSLLEAAKPQEAIAEYTLALKELPDSPAAHNGLGSALADLGQVKDAEAHFLEAIRLKPDFAGAHQNLGDLLEGRGRLEEAVVQYTEALKSDPRSAEAHNNLGVILVRLGKPDEAVDHFKAALAIQPDYADARTNLAKVLSRRKPSKTPPAA